MSRFTVIQPELLARMQVLESISTENILAARMARFKSLWMFYDPPNGAQYDVGELEFDPIKINQENATFFELMLRDRVNQAARSITLAFGSGTDLDGIATRYPGGVPRLVNESDTRYRRRVWSSPNPLGPHGTPEAYEFWALTALSTLRDARTRKIRPRLEDDPIILVACLADADDPRPSQADLLTVRRYIQSDSRQAITDVISVVPPKVLEIDYEINFWVFPGVDPGVVNPQLQTGLATLIENQRWLGYDHTRAAIAQTCMNVQGVYNAIVLKPEQDALVETDWFVKVNSVTLHYMGTLE